MMRATGRVFERIEELFVLAPEEDGGASRPAFSPDEARAMRLVAGWARAAGLEPGIDPHGSLWCLPPGEEPCVTSGSHVDTVPGGRYDGPLGTVLAVEATGRVGGNRGILVCAAEEAVVPDDVGAAPEVLCELVRNLQAAKTPAGRR